MRGLGEGREGEGGEHWKREVGEQGGRQDETESEK